MDWRFNKVSGSHLRNQVTLKMTSAQDIETSVATKSPSQDPFHPDDLIQSKCGLLRQNVKVVRTNRKSNLPFNNCYDQQNEKVPKTKLESRNRS